MTELTTRTKWFRWSLAARCGSAGGIAVFGVAAGAAMAFLASRPELVFGDGALLDDDGLNLVVADRLLDGARLYADVDYPYGFFPPYAFSAVAAIFGNTLRVHAVYTSVVSALALALAYALVLRLSRSRAVAGTAALLLLPALVFPFPTSGSSPPYAQWERVGLLALALAWTPIARRTRARAAVLGTIAASLQFLRFGTALVAISALLLIDATSLLSRRDTPPRREWVHTTLALLLGAGLVEAIRIAICFSLLPAPLARDTAWPLYHLQVYASWVTDELRWPTWSGSAFFLSRQLPYAVALAVGMLGFVRFARERAASDEESTPPGESGGVLFLLAFYVIASIAYFRQAFHFYQYAWMLLAPALVELQRLRRTRLALWIVFAAPLLLALKIGFINDRTAGLREIITPRADRVWMSGEGAEFVERLNAELSRLRSEESNRNDARATTLFLGFPGLGLRAAYDIPFATRNHWMQPGLLRPYDTGPLLESLDETLAVVACKGRTTRAAMPGRDVCDWVGQAPFDTEVCSALLGRVSDAAPLSETCWLFPLQSGGSG